MLLKASILDNDLKVRCANYDNPFAAVGEEDDPEENASEVTELQQLVSPLGNGENSYSASEFIAADDYKHSLMI